MLIDSSHKPWLLGTLAAGFLATALYVWLDRITPGGLSGGTTIGLWYGIAGSLLMIFAGLLSALRRVPSWWWIGSRTLWLKGHVWLGLLSGVFILCHSGFRWGGLLERVLWSVLGLILASGVFGLMLQQILPRMITARVPHETPYEQIPQVCRALRSAADSLTEKALGPLDAGVAVAESTKSDTEHGVETQIKEFYKSQVRPFLDGQYRRSSPLAHPLRAEAAFARVRGLALSPPLTEHVAQLEQFCEERRQLAEQERLWRWLHGWLFVHVPLSMVLLVLGLAHVVVSLEY